MAEKEYIERRALMEDARHDKAIMADLAGIADVANLINDQPTADVVEVRHGKWCLIEYEYLVCNKCGHWHYTGCESTAEAKEKMQNGEVPNYCSNCGAKMDGKG